MPKGNYAVTMDPSLTAERRLEAAEYLLSVNGRFWLNTDFDTNRLITKDNLLYVLADMLDQHEISNTQ